MKIAIARPDTSKPESAKVEAEKFNTPASKSGPPSPKGWRPGSEIRGYDGKRGRAG